MLALFKEADDIVKKMIAYEEKVDRVKEIIGANKESDLSDDDTNEPSTRTPSTLLSSLKQENISTSNEGQVVINDEGQPHPKVLTHSNLLVTHILYRILIQLKIQSPT